MDSPLTHPQVFFKVYSSRGQPDWPRPLLDWQVSGLVQVWLRVCRQSVCRWVGPLKLINIRPIHSILVKLQLRHLPAKWVHRRTRKCDMWCVCHNQRQRWQQTTTTTTTKDEEDRTWLWRCPTTQPLGTSRISLDRPPKMTNDNHQKIVLPGPVRSGFLPRSGGNRNRDPFFFAPGWARLQLDLKRPVHIGFFRLKDRS